MFSRTKLLGMDKQQHTGDRAKTSLLRFIAMQLVHAHRARCDRSMCRLCCHWFQFILCGLSCQIYTTGRLPWGTRGPLSTQAAHNLLQQHSYDTVNLQAKNSPQAQVEQAKRLGRKVWLLLLCSSMLEITWCPLSWFISPISY